MFGHTHHSDNQATTWCFRQASKETLKVACILMLVFGFFLICTFIFFLASVSYEIGDVCNDIYTVSVGEQPQCRTYSTNADALVLGKKVTTYQYDIADAMKLEEEVRKFSFKYEETVEPASLVSFNLTHVTGDFQSLSVHYKLSSTASIYVLDNIFFDIFTHENEVRQALEKKEKVTDWEYSYNGTDDIHIVVKNDGKSPIKITEEGWIQKKLLKMDTSLAISVCQPGKKCRINNTKSSVFILDYDGEERTVPMTMLYNYDFDYSLISAIFSFVLICIVPFIFSAIFYYSSLHAKSRKELEQHEAAYVPVLTSEAKTEEEQKAQDTSLSDDSVIPERP